MKKATLALENGQTFDGVSIGADGETEGEVVFNTSLTGYQEVLTDPSYSGQIVTMTAPQIGNYGVTAEDCESRKTSVAGFVAGVTLGSISGTLEMMPGLLVLIPASVGMRGTIFGAMGARLGTEIAAGVFEPSLRSGRSLRRNAEVAATSSILSSFYLAGLAKLVASAFGEETISFWDLVTISVAGGVLSSIVVLVVTVVLAVQSFRRGWDLDAGIMADFVYARLGVTVRNMFEPDFGGIAEDEITLKRQARLGLAVLPAAGVTLAMDVDLNTVGLRDGLRRMFALGGESRLGTRLAVRAGVRWDLEGPKQTITAFGASVAIRPGMWIDGHASLSQHDGDRGFGVAFRSGY